MISRLLFIPVWASLLLNCIIGSPVQGQSPWMADGGVVAAPKGFTAYCLNPGGHLRGCESGTPVIVDWRRERAAGLEAFNRRMNARIRYQEDRKRFGVSDRWLAAIATGDCEDIALAKRGALVAAGWPPGALWLALGWTPKTGTHAVLVLRTDEGDYVLDNRSDGLRLWHETGLHWLIRQRPDTVERWEVIRTAG